eukprot:scaffold30338_cov148-Skeletonema_menzelii.AAC.2
MATIDDNTSLYHQSRQRQLQRNGVIDQCPPPQYKAELLREELDESEKEGIFVDMMEKSTAFFDAIGTSDSVSSNPFVSTTSIKVNTIADAAANPSIYSTTTSESELNDARDASSTVPSSHMLGLMLDAERQAASPVCTSSDKPIHDSPAISVDSIKMTDSDFEEISLSSAEDEDDIATARSLGAAPEQDVVNRDLAALEEKQNASSDATVKSNVSLDISDQALFDSDSDEEIEEVHRHVDDVSTMTEETYSRILSNGAKPFFTPYSSQPFTFAEMQGDGMQKQDELSPSRRRSKSAEDVFMQRLEEIAAQRSIIAQIAIKFEDVVMSVCGQEEEVLYVVVEEDDEEEDQEKEELEEKATDNKSSYSKPASKAKDDMLETPIHEKANEENEETALGMAGLLKTIQISRVGKLTTKDRVLVPLYERAVLQLVSLENQVMRKSRAIEIGKRTLASCNRSNDKVNVATSIAFLEVEVKETKRKIGQSRESLQRLYEAFSLETQKAIDDLQMDGFR